MTVLIIFLINLQTVINPQMLSIRSQGGRYKCDKYDVSTRSVPGYEKNNFFKKPNKPGGLYWLLGSGWLNPSFQLNGIWGFHEC